MTKQTTRSAFNSDCNDPNLQIFVAGIHSISEWNFNAWRRNYNPSNLAGKNFSTTYIRSLLDQADCNSTHIEVGPPGNGEGQPGINDDIELSIQPTIMKTYSIALFRGVIRLYEPDQFSFYKARKSQTHFDIIFKAEKLSTDADDDPTTVYYGDVSETQP